MIGFSLKAIVTPLFLLLLGFPHCLIRSSAGQNAISDEKVILIDTDAGTDDAWAILLAAAAYKAGPSTNIKIVGITTLCGNADVKNVNNNVARTLRVANESRVPIYEGMGEFIMGPFKHMDEPPFNGLNGFGDADLPTIEPPKIEEEHAANAIIRLAEEYKGRLIVVTLGPLTNIAMAVKLKPAIKHQIKELYIIGGSQDAFGNVRPAAEFNFFADPEAASITIDSFHPCPITILPWETSLLKAASAYEFRTETLGKMDTPQMQLLNAIEAPALKRVTDVWIPADALLMACVINPKIITETENHPAQVELAGTLTRGMLVVDKRSGEDEPGKSNIRFITNVDKSTFQTYMVWTALGSSSSTTPKI